MRLDLSLYLVTDRALSAPRGIEDVVEAAVRGGVTIVQLREKECDTREFVGLARALKRKLDGTGVPLIINDRVDVALAAGVAGVHLGQTDMEVADARRLLGAEAIIGLSVERMEDVTCAAELPVDYLGVSPVFPTPTKTDTAPAWGLAGLATLRKVTPLPLVAIGGIHPDNAAAVMKAGAEGIAAVSAICAAPDPERAARELKSIISHR